MLSSFKSKIGNVFLPIHLWAFSNGVRSEGSLLPYFYRFWCHYPLLLLVFFCCRLFSTDVTAMCPKMKQYRYIMIVSDIMIRISTRKSKSSLKSFSFRPYNFFKEIFNFRCTYPRNLKNRVLTSLFHKFEDICIPQIPSCVITLN